MTKNLSELEINAYIRSLTNAEKLEDPNELPQVRIARQLLDSRIALKTIAKYPINGARDMDAINIQKIAIDAL